MATEKIGEHTGCSFEGEVEKRDGIWWCPQCAEICWEQQ